MNDQVRKVISNKTNVMDKSIVAMCLLHADRRRHKLETGKDLTGIGPNRDDGPVFFKLIGKYIDKAPIKKDDLFSARHRVSKYTRQLQSSPYWNNIHDPNFTHNMMLEQYSAKIEALRADEELAEFLKEGVDYGHW